MRTGTALFLAVACIAITAPASARTRYVDQGNPAASDQSPGTEVQPWKTVARACGATTRGDTVYIKAGLYREQLEPKSDGVTFCAFGDDRVVLKTDDRVTEISPSAWTRVPDRKSVYTCGLAVPDGSDGKVVRVDGKAIAFELTRGVANITTGATGERRDVDVTRALEDENVRRWTLDSDGKLCINLGDESPAAHRVELVRLGAERVLIERNDCRVRGLELDGLAVWLTGRGNVVEDCLITSAGRITDRACTVLPESIIRRCTFIRCGRCINDGIFEENLLVGELRQAPEKDPPQVPRQEHYGGYRWHMALESHRLARYNVIVDATHWGAWIDCNTVGSTCYGNAFWRNGSGGFYNEAGCHDTNILYNTFVENGGWGITMRAANRVLIQYNLVKGHPRYGIGFWNLRPWPTPTGNIASRNLIQDNPAVFMWEMPDSPDSVIALHNARSNLYNGNIYGLPPGGVFCTPGIAAQADFEKVIGVTTGCRRDDDATMEDFGLGTVTFRVPYSDHPEEPVPMIANLWGTGIHGEPVGNHRDTGDFYGTLFWMQGTGDSMPSPAPDRTLRGIEEMGGRNNGWPEGGTPIPGKPEKPDGDPLFWAQILPASPQGMSQEGTGWWSRTLPTVPGARIRVSVRVSGQDLEPVEGQSIVAFVRFSSATDQRVTRQYLIGSDAKEHVLKGTFPWQTLAKELTAPPDAVRFALFMGVRPCKGNARFSQIQINTLPGWKPASRDMPKNVAYEHIDLNGFYNRDLGDNVTGRLIEKGDWPGKLNLSKPKDGSQIRAGIPFKIDRAIVLRSSMFPQVKGMPLEVRGIPVNRKVEGLYFYSQGIYPIADREQYRFVVHIADDSKAELPFVSGWEAVPQRVNIQDLSILPGGVMQWVNPKPDMAVKSIDFVGADTGEAALLAITAAIAR